MKYVISDLHGYRFEDFLALLESAGFGEDDLLYLLGDVIDRGEDGAKYLEWALTAERVVFILGNHERMMSKCEFLCEQIMNDCVELTDRERFDDIKLWLHNGAQNTIMGLVKLEHEKPGICRKIFDFIKNAPLYAEVSAGGRDFVLVHGGLGNFSPDKPLDRYDVDDLVWTRPALTDRYYENKTVVFGHTPTLFYGREHTGRMITADTWIDVDAGTAASLPPLLLRLDDMAQFRPEGYEERIREFCERE